MAKYVQKVGQLRKESQEAKKLSPYSENPHEPDYANVSKISTTPEPTRSQVDLNNHPLSGGASGSSLSNSSFTTITNTNSSNTPTKSATSSNTKPNTSKSRSIPNIPLPRPVRGGNPKNKKMSQNMSNTGSSATPHNSNNTPNKPNTNINANNSNNQNSNVSKSQLNLPQLNKNQINATGQNPFRNQRQQLQQARMANNNPNSNKLSQSYELANGRNIFDISLNANRTKVVSMSAFSYLFCELINYSQKGIHNIAQLEDKLSEIGYNIGVKQLELIIYRNKPGKREIDRIGILEFIQKIVWKRLFQKVADGLEQSTSNKNEFFIIDNAPITNTFVSVPNELGQFNCASFIGGIIHGILENAGFPCKVITHEAPMDENDGNGNGNSSGSSGNSSNDNASSLMNITKLEKMRTVFIIQFQQKK